MLGLPKRAPALALAGKGVALARPEGGNLRCESTSSIGT